MRSLQECMIEFRNQLEKGVIQKAYLGLLEYITSLKHHFANKYPEYSMPGNIYTGYMNMTYFSIIPRSLKDHELKIAIVFLYDTFRFEIWLSGKNKQVLEKYWLILKKSKWTKYKIVEPAMGIDCIVQHILVEQPDFSDPAALTKQIDQGTMEFIKDIESFIARNAP